MTPSLTNLSFRNCETMGPKKPFGKCIVGQKIGCHGYVFPGRSKSRAPNWPTACAARVKKLTTSSNVAHTKWAMLLKDIYIYIYIYMNMNILMNGTQYYGFRYANMCIYIYNIIYIYVCICICMYGLWTVHVNDV